MTNIKEFIKKNKNWLLIGGAALVVFFIFTGSKKQTGIVTPVVIG
jgi:hypothetical protein